MCCAGDKCLPGTAGLPKPEFEKEYLDCVLGAAPKYERKFSDDIGSLEKKCFPSLFLYVKCPDWPPPADFNKFDKAWKKRYPKGYFGDVDRDLEGSRVRRALTMVGEAAAGPGAHSQLLQLAQSPHGNAITNLMQSVALVQKSRMVPEQFQTVELAEDDSSTAMQVLGKAAEAEGPIKMRDWDVHFKLWGITQKDLDAAGITRKNLTDWTVIINNAMKEGNANIDGKPIIEDQVIEGDYFAHKTFHSIADYTFANPGCGLATGNVTAVNEFNSVVVPNVMTYIQFGLAYGFGLALVSIVALWYGVQLWWRKREFQPQYDMLGAPFIAGQGQPGQVNAVAPYEQSQFQPAAPRPPAQNPNLA